MKKLLSALALLGLFFVLPAVAQQQVNPTNIIACAYNTSPPTATSGNAVLVQCDATGKLITSGSSSIGSVTQGTTPWIDSVSYWAGVALGAPSNYGTSPGAVSVPGVNAFITNSPTIANNSFGISGTLPAFAATPTVNVGTFPSLPAGSNAIGSITNTGFGITGTLPAFAATPTVNAAESGTWQVTPTLTTVSTLTLTATTTAYTAGQLVANNATAGLITNPSFTMPALGGAIPRIRIQTTDTLSTAWASASIQVDLWSAAPTWTNGDHGTWLPATGSASHIASFSCSFPSAVWGDGLATECTPNQGNYASLTSTTVYWSVQATSGSGVLTASKAIKLIAELN